MHDPALNAIVEAMISLARGDASARAPRDSGDDLIDAIAAGVNMMAEEIAARNDSAERRLAHLVRHSSDGIIAVKVDGTVTDWNAGAERLLGWTAEEVVGKPVSIVVPEDRRHELQAIRQAQDGPPPASFETERVARDGTMIPVSITVSPIRNELGDTVGVAAILRDLRDRRRAQKATRHSEGLLRGQEMERQRVSRELHDGVNQLLAAAKLQLEVMQDGNGADDRVARVVNLLNDAIAEIRRISHELRPLVLDDIGLEAALRNICEHLDQPGRVRVSAQCDLGVRLSAPVEAGLFRIAQEATNNALRHSQGSRIRVELQREGEEIVLQVADDGIGFDSSTTDPGIGLINIEHRSRQLGGVATVRSAPNDGTTVEVRVPLPTDDHRMDADT